MFNREERYKAAIEAHKHYDNLSLAVVTGMISLSAVVLVFTKEKDFFTPLWFIYLACAIINLLLFVIYDSLARSAGIARAVACEVECYPDADIAVSKAYLASRPNEYICRRKGQIYKTVFVLMVFISLGMLGLSYHAYSEVNDLVQPTATATAVNGALAKGSPVQADRCNKELKWAVSLCDREFKQHQDTRKHADCLAAARANYDTCMDPGAK